MTSLRHSVPSFGFCRPVKWFLRDDEFGGLPFYLAIVTDSHRKFMVAVDGKQFWFSTLDNPRTHD